MLGIIAASCSSGGDARSADLTTPATTNANVTALSDGPASVPTPATDSPATESSATDPEAEDPLSTQPTPPTTARPRGIPVVSAESIGQFDAPVGLAVRPNDDSLYVIEQAGRIIRVTGSEKTLAADIRDRVKSGGEQGLLGLAFSNTQGLAYLNYTNSAGSTVVAEFPLDGAGTFDTSSERILLMVAQPFGNHNGGELAIGPDDRLYIALGDGGSGNDPGRRASDPRSLLGSLLRIDPTPSEQSPYSIPPDNPFANGDFNGLAGAPEVWSWGLRNPWKLAFDRETGDLWIADVGQREFEEINRVAANDRPAGHGANFGWSAFEGRARFNDDVADPGNAIAPVLTYEHGPNGCSISGGALYRGSTIAELAPAFVYSDFCSGILWALDAETGRNLVLLEGLSDVTAVRSGPNDTLYVLQRTGELLLIS